MFKDLKQNFDQQISFMTCLGHILKISGLEESNGETLEKEVAKVLDEIVKKPVIKNVFVLVPEKQTVHDPFT